MSDSNNGSFKDNITETKGLVENVPTPSSAIPANPSSSMEEMLVKSGYFGSPQSLSYVLSKANMPRAKKAPALAFIESPTMNSSRAEFPNSRGKLIPYNILKDVRVTDSLVASIMRARGSMMSLFGSLQKDRFDIGIKVKIRDDFQKYLTPEQYEKVVSRIKKTEQLLLNCGYTEGLQQRDRSTLAEFFDVQSRNGLTFGRFATEIIYDRAGDPGPDGRYPFFRFRPIDVATIVRPFRKGEDAGSQLRLSALKTIENMTGEKFDIDLRKLEEDEYAWVQYVDGTRKQGFLDEEMLVFDLFPSTDIEHKGFPVSPIDTVYRSISTHISIDVYKELYFQNGRATKGMLLVKSSSMTQEALNNMTLQFNASINSVSNSFRTPVMGMEPEDEIQWVPMSGEGARDADFQFMYDQVARNILSAFSLSPDELPGYGHLSKGTNAHTLSECFDPETYILTREGSFKATVLLGDLEENKDIEVWTGIGWNKARIFKTGKKQLCETVVSSGKSIKTSPDHKFRVVDEDCQLVWKKQCELEVGDLLLMGIDSAVDQELEYQTNHYAADYSKTCFADRVVEITHFDEEIDMVDVEVFNDEHMFMLNGFMVHNSNNEFKLTAARDTGLRPLIAKFQTFLNQRLFPLIDPLLSKICEIKLVGLDAQSKEQESARLQQDMATHMSYDEVLHSVEKEAVGEAAGGKFPFNERYQLILDKYMDVGAIRTRFFGDSSGAVDPLLKYKRDPFFLQWLQLLSQTNAAAVQALFAPKPYALEFLKMNLEDELADEE